MPSEDWYYDQFDVEQKGGGFDLSDEQTSALDDMSDEDAADYESRFIDELYGTENRQTIIDGKNVEYSREDWVRTSEDDDGAIAREDVEAHWGLDLRRVDNEDLKPGTDDHFLHMTRGRIDWAAYQKDQAFIKAMKDIGKNASDLDDDEVPVEDRVEWIREANESMGTKKDDKRTEPKGEYDSDKITTKPIVNEKGEEIGRDLYIDGDRQKTLSETYAAGEGRRDVSFSYYRKDPDGKEVKVDVGPKGGLSDSAYDPIVGPSTVVVKPNIKIRDVQVKVPDSLKQWKSDAKQTLKVGGERNV